MTADLNLHVDLPGYEVRDNCLVVGGRSLLSIADEAGGRPFYAYDRQLIDARIRELREAVPESIDIHYAVKANPMPELVGFVAERVAGLDVASGRELEIALAGGADPAEISFAGPGKSDDELAMSCDAGITINAESANELARIDRIGTEKGIRPNVAIRVNPDFALKASGMKMSGGPQQFGIDAEVVPSVIAEQNWERLNFRGFHIFCGSQNLRSEAICEAQSNAVALAIELSKSAPRRPEFVNIGGGFGIPYFPGDQRLDLSPIAHNLRVLTDTVSDELEGSKLVLELGRFIVGEAGIYVCHVVDKKVSRGTVFVVCDGGLHHHLAASGNFGQILRKNYPVLIGNRVSAEDPVTVTVVGPLCTPLDLLADRMPMADPQIGDLVVVFQSGAYGYSASPIGFLSHPSPAELFV